MESLHITRIEDILGLSRKVVAALSDVPGVTEVTVFGSCADGRCDQFSDVDIHATTKNLRSTRAGLDSALSGTLTSDEHRSADLRLDAAQRRLLIADLDFSDPAAMDRAVVRLIHELIAIYRTHRSPAPIPDRLLRRLPVCTEELLR